MNKALEYFIRAIESTLEAANSCLNKEDLAQLNIRIVNNIASREWSQKESSDG